MLTLVRVDLHGLDVHRSRILLDRVRFRAIATLDPVNNDPSEDSVQIAGRVHGVPRGFQIAHRCPMVVECSIVNCYEDIRPVFAILSGHDAVDLELESRFTPITVSEVASQLEQLLSSYMGTLATYCLIRGTATRSSPDRGYAEFAIAATDVTSGQGTHSRGYFARGSTTASWFLGPIGEGKKKIELRYAGTSVVRVVDLLRGHVRSLGEITFESEPTLRVTIELIPVRPDTDLALVVTVLLPSGARSVVPVRLCSNQFELSGIPASATALQLQAFQRGFVPYRLTVPLESSAIRLEIPAPAPLRRLDGLVIDRRGTPIDGVFIWSESDFAESDANGNFSLYSEGGSDSTFKLRASCQGYVDCEVLIQSNQRAKIVMESSA